MKVLSEVFADNLKHFRKAAALTQKQLGIKLGYTEKAVAKWESGRTIPPAETLLRLSEVLQTSIDSLLEHQKAPEYFLGIDGGATKSLFALADANGKVIRHFRLGPCNPVDIGIEKAEAILSTGIKEISRGIPYSAISLYAGLAGGNVSGNKKIFTEFFKSFRFAAVQVDSDAMNIIGAGLADSNGIAIIMGTGCVAFTQKNGVHKQYGGFGYLFDDGGDGYNFGRDAIHAALYDENGIGEHTAITELLNDATGKTANEMLSEYYNGGKSYIASFSRIVFEAYKKGDNVAEKIIKQNMEQIANLINCAIKDLEDEELPVKVVFVGGLTANADILFKYIESFLDNRKAVQLSVYPYEPVIGALKLAGANIDTDSSNGISRRELTT